MDVFEIVGLLILLLAIAAPFLKRIFEKRDEKKHPEEYARKRQIREEQQKRLLREIMGDLPEEIEMEELPPEEEPQPFPPRRPISRVARRDFESSFDDYETHSTIEDRHIDSDVVSERLQRPRDVSYAFQRGRMSDIKSLISRKGVGREMVLLHEIISPPVSMRDPLQ